MIITNKNQIIETYSFKVFDKMLTELSPYLTEIEVDKVMDFLVTIQDSKYDINPTVDDVKTQMKLIIGSERFLQVVDEWNKNNQKILTVFGKLKYKNKKDPSDKTLYDGLDPEDKPEDYEKVYV